MRQFTEFARELFIGTVITQIWRQRYMKERILKECKNNIGMFSKMSDIEIYNWLCENYWCKDYKMLRECSFIIFNENIG